MGKIVAIYGTDKGLITNIYREPKLIHSKKQLNQFKAWAIDLNRLFSKEDYTLCWQLSKDRR